MHICADYQVNISRSKILYCGKYRISDLLRTFFMTSQLVTFLI